MRDDEGNAGDGDHGGFEDHVGDFVVGELAVETLLEFGDAEDGADVNC